MRIDLDYIKKWMKISDEELMERLVKDAVGLQEEAREREHQTIVKERMQDKTYNTAFMREFFASYNYLHDYFSDKEILTACKHHADKSDMAKEIAVRGHRDEASLGIRFVKHTRTEFTESRSGWSRTVMDNGTIVLMTSPYQSRFAGKVIEELLLQKLPYLKDFAVSIHGIYDKEQDLIFIKRKHVHHTAYRAVLSVRQLYHSSLRLAVERRALYQYDPLPLFLYLFLYFSTDRLPRLCRLR